MHAQAHRKHPLPLQNQTGRVEVGKRIGFGAIMAKRTVAAKVFASGAVMCNKLLGAQSVKNLKLPSHRIGRACQPAGLGKFTILSLHAWRHDPHQNRESLFSTFDHDKRCAKKNGGSCL